MLWLGAQIIECIAHMMHQAAGDDVMEILLTMYHIAAYGNEPDDMPTAGNA